MISLLFRRRKLLDDPKALGLWGERYAGRFLKRKGFLLLEGGFTRKTGEIDLVMADREGGIVFVEVKTRRSEDFADATSAITHHKKMRLARTAKQFLAKHRLEERPSRFDVVTIVLGEEGRPQLNHYERAFVP